MAGLQDDTNAVTIAKGTLESSSLLIQFDNPLPGSNKITYVDV